MAIGNFECKICKSREFRQDVKKKDYQYVVCLGCGTSQIYPTPDKDSLNKFYKNYEGEGGVYIKSREEDKDDCFETFDLNLSDLKFDLNKVKKALDVGCATGIFMEYLKKNKVDATGIDVSADMVKSAKKKGLNASSTDLFDLSGKFDLVTLWDVLEHFTDPLKALKKVNNLLADDGNLVIETPCRGIISDKFGADWRHYNPPQHTFLFDQNALFGILKKTGFSVVNWVRFGSGNTSGTIPPKVKLIFDSICKELGMGDSIIVSAKKF